MTLIICSHGLFRLEMIVIYMERFYSGLFHKCTQMARVSIRTRYRGDCISCRYGNGLWGGYRSGKCDTLRYTDPFLINNFTGRLLLNLHPSMNEEGIDRASADDYSIYHSRWTMKSVGQREIFILRKWRF